MIILWASEGLAAERGLKKVGMFCYRRMAFGDMGEGRSLAHAFMRRRCGSRRTSD